MVKKEKIALGVIVTAVALGTVAVVVNEAKKLPPITPPTEPPDTEPPVQCPIGFTLQNGVCVPDVVIPPIDPEVITFFDVNPRSGQSPLVVGISINVVGTRTRTVFKFGDGTSDVVKTSGTQHLVNHNYLSPGNYNGQVEVTREDGVKDTANFSISVISPPPPPPSQTLQITSFFQSKSIGTIPFEVSISASVNEPLASASINWDDGTTTQLGTNLNADHTYTQEGIFNGKLVVLGVNGQSAQRSFQVNGNPDVSVPQGEIIVTGKNESVYSFFANFQGSGLIYRWDFGDGTKRDGPQSISHSYSKVGTFTVSVEVIDQNGKKGNDTVLVSIRETDLQAELGEAQIQNITDTGFFDFVWKINNVTERVLILEYTLRLFDKDGKQVDSRIISFGLDPFSSITVNYNLPNLQPGNYNLELEVQDGNTKQLVAFDSEVVVIGGPTPSIDAKFQIFSAVAIATSQGFNLVGSGIYVNDSNQIINPDLIIEITEDGRFGKYIFARVTVLPKETVPANSSKPFALFTGRNALDGAKYTFEVVMKIDGVEIQRTPLSTTFQA